MLETMVYICDFFSFFHTGWVVRTWRSSSTLPTLACLWPACKDPCVTFHTHIHTTCIWLYPLFNKCVKKQKKTIWQITSCISCLFETDLKWKETFPWLHCCKKKKGKKDAHFCCGVCWKMIPPPGGGGLELFSWSRACWSKREWKWKRVDVRLYVCVSSLLNNKSERVCVCVCVCWMKVRQQCSCCVCHSSNRWPSILSVLWVKCEKVWAGLRIGAMRWFSFFFSFFFFFFFFSPQDSRRFDTLDTALPVSVRDRPVIKQNPWCHITASGRWKGSCENLLLLIIVRDGKLNILELLAIHVAKQHANDNKMSNSHYFLTFYRSYVESKSNKSTDGLNDDILQLLLCLCARPPGAFRRSISHIMGVLSLSISWPRW